MQRIEIGAVAGYLDDFDDWDECEEAFLAPALSPNRKSEQIEQRFELYSAYHFQTYCTCSYRPNVTGVIRLASMYLRPLHWRPRILTHTPTYRPAHTQQIAVNALIDEAAALLELFNDVSLALGPYVKLNDIDRIQSYDINVPASKWQPVLSASCTALEKCLANFTPKSHLHSSVYASEHRL